MNNKHTVLVVEDEPVLLQALDEKLTREGFTVLKAKDGEEGLDMILQNHPDMTLLDIVMPKMDGMEMLRQVRNDAWGKDAKVILLTNLSDAERVSDALGLGTYDFLVKSDWKIQDVVEKVRQRLGK